VPRTGEAKGKGWGKLRTLVGEISVGVFGGGGGITTTGKNARGRDINWRKKNLRHERNFGISKRMSREQEEKKPHETREKKL